MALTAGDVMKTELITVTPSTSLTEFARLCAEDNISGAPVTRVDGTLVGIVSKTDLVQRLMDTHPAHGTVDEPSFWDQDTLQVGDIMSEVVATVPPAATLSEIAERMASDRIHRVLVTDAGKLLGIVTSIDLLAHFPR
ncbi:MAG: CBS domain-containing protein [Planctomycetota bacterium]|jgi:CBS domain-containing protein